MVSSLTDVVNGILSIASDPSWHGCLSKRHRWACLSSSVKNVIIYERCLSKHGREAWGIYAACLPSVFCTTWIQGQRCDHSLSFISRPRHKHSTIKMITVLNSYWKFPFPLRGSTESIPYFFLQTNENELKIKGRIQHTLLMSINMTLLILIHY